MDEFEAQEHYEKFMNFFDKWKLEIEEISKRAKKFSEQLSDETIQLSIRYFPELEEHKQVFAEPLKETLIKLSYEILEVFDGMLYSNSEDEYQYNSGVVPERDQSEKERIYRENILKTMPPEQHEYFLKMEDARVNNEAFEREFMFQWHDKIKEILYLHYPEIKDFSSNYLRYLNFSTYTDIVVYIHEFYYHTEDYITDRFPWPD